jgi:CRP-like cAMP-binding protein
VIGVREAEPSSVSHLRPPSRLAGTRLWAPFLSRQERVALDSVTSPPRAIGPNTDILREGARTDSLYVVLKGWACRYSTTRQGGRHLPALLVAGDIGNLDSLMFDRVDYGVRTFTQASVAVLPRERALALSAEHPGIARLFTRLALIENAMLTRWALSLGRRSAKERLAHLLCELSLRLGGETGNASSFVLPLTQEHIGDALGLTHVHVNRTLQLLRAEGLMESESRIVTLRDVAALRRIAGFDPHYLHIDAAAIVEPA